MALVVVIANALAIHEKLMLHGIRYRPNYKIAIAESFPHITGSHLRPPTHRRHQNQPSRCRASPLKVLFF